MKMTSLENVTDKIFVIHATGADGTVYEQALGSFDAATSTLNAIAVENNWEQEVIDSMSIVRFAVDKVFKPEILLSLSFPDPE